MQVSSKVSSYPRSFRDTNSNEKYSQDLDISYCKKGLKVDPHNALSHFNMGNALWAAGNLGAAITSFKKALSIEPDYTEAHYSMGNVLQDNHDFEAAIISYRKALRIQPNFAHAYNNMGNTLRKKGDFGAAIISYKQALKINPNLTETCNNLGNILDQNGDTTAALESFKQALNTKPDCTETYNNIGSLLTKNGHMEGALEAFRQALNIEPNCVKTYGNIAVAFLAMDNTELAIQAFEQIINIEPDHLIAQHTLNALTGKQTESVPDGYIEKLFDNYASKFEHSLVDTLEYKIPKLIAELVSKHRPGAAFDSMLDLGCGTGLAGVEFKGLCQNIEGIDLSKKMLIEAGQKNVYDKLNHTGILEYLSEARLDFDLFVSADVFVYVGDLSEVFRLIKSHNKRKGLLVFSTEHTELDGFHLEQTGRYSHSKSYIESLCAEFGYNLLHFSNACLRKEKDDFLTGGVYLLEF